MPRIVLQVWEVSFWGIVFKGAPYRFAEVLTSQIIEQPSVLLYDNGNFDPDSYRGYIKVILG